MDAECVFKRTMILGKNFMIMLQCAVTNYMAWSFLTFLQTVFLGLLLYIGITKRPEISVKSPVVPGSADYRLDNQCFHKFMFKMKIFVSLLLESKNILCFGDKTGQSQNTFQICIQLLLLFLKNTEVWVKWYKICKT